MPKRCATDGPARLVAEYRSESVSVSRKEIHVDDPTPNQKIASDIVECWYRALTEAAQATISEHDLMSLTDMLTQALDGELDFLAGPPSGPVEEGASNVG